MQGTNNFNVFWRRLGPRQTWDGVEMDIFGERLNYVSPVLRLSGLPFAFC